MACVGKTSTDKKQPIQTFAFLDLETTGLKEPRITELGMVMVHRNALLSAQSHVIPTGDGELVVEDSIKLPRLADVLSLCFDPGKEIEAEASQLTGINASDITACKKLTFDLNAVDALTAILQRQEHQICLVAHNGVKFDFPIIHKELEILSRKLTIDLQCVDSLHAFRQISEDRSKEVHNAELQRPSGQSGSQACNGQPARDYSRTGKACSLYHKPCFKPFNLKAIYQRKFGSDPPGHHGALDDVYSLLKVVITDADRFVQWADRHATLFHC